MCRIYLKTENSEFSWWNSSKIFSHFTILFLPHYKFFQILTVPNMGIAESMAHLIDGYQIMLSQQPSLWSVQGLSPPQFFFLNDAICFFFPQKNMKKRIINIFIHFKKLSKLNDPKRKFVHFIFAKTESLSPLSLFPIIILMFSWVIYFPPLFWQTFLKMVLHFFYYLFHPKNYWNFSTAKILIFIGAPDWF